MLTGSIGFLAGEDLGQQVEQVLRTLGRDFLLGLLLMGHGIAKELHLAPEVVTLCTFIRMFENLLVTLHQRKQ